MEHVHSSDRHSHESGLHSFGGSSRNPEEVRNGDADVLESNITKNKQYHIWSSIRST